MCLEIVHFIIAHRSCNFFHHLQRNRLTSNVKQESTRLKTRIITHLPNIVSLIVFFIHLKDCLHAIHVTCGVNRCNIDTVFLNIHRISFFSEKLIRRFQLKVECIRLSPAFFRCQLDSREILIITYKLIYNIF